MARRGRKPGTPKTGSRKRGTPNKATAEVKVLALSYAPEAFEELSRLAKRAKSESARVAAIKEILDRAYGKPQVSHQHSLPPEVLKPRDEEAVSETTRWLQKILAPNVVDFPRRDEGLNS